MSPADGRAIVRSSWIGTGIFVVVVATALAFTGARLPAAIVDLGLFFGGCGVFLWALAAAAGRSRQHQVSLWNLFLLEGAAPPKVRRALLGSLAVEVLAAMATSWVSAALAFGWLVPLWALGHCGLWGARYGTFTARLPAPGPHERQPQG
jgi:hypothetical protein